MVTTQEELPRAHRPHDGRLVSGVCAGIAAHLGLDPVIIRLAVIGLSVGGLGVAAYVALVFFMPPAPAAPPDTDTAGGRSGATAAPTRDRGQLLAYGLVAAGFMVLSMLVTPGFDPALWLIVFGALGTGILWQQTDADVRGRWVASTNFRVRQTWVRSVVGVGLVMVGVTGFLAFRQELSDAREGLSATLAILVGVGVIAAPWVIKLVRERDRERQERVRSQEREELAAHIHDSVLHTLTLIQRNADDPKEVQKLARVQERSLRAWLYQRPADAETTVAPALERLAGEVEEAHGVAIEVVCVGDCPIDPSTRAVLQAAREAMVNAAKYSGTPNVSVYAEVEPEEFMVFVRDRGRGFDLDAVPGDRMGVRQSIIGRMERHGGTARIRTEPGEGTEVQLRIARTREEEPE
ncbi:ATP-binding protein [Allonocardiopsis opalescens]|uniref:Phage shock protein C (PspC) family protein n=1 Tax=Allonocardiopsis opalescens TaxID=1144618 RepID=A0A2T0Q8J1_9ACTN|nr:ATP-binding protein [Allonocardiopsis opalescens]PRY00074.1 phage shock protein C (PspC) family protein [Allonocardiopsis opalescens]